MPKQESKYKLHEAANNGDVKELKKILRKSKPEAVNQLDARHWSSLHCAANARNLSCCKLLIEQKADPHILTSTNNTALHFLVTIRDEPELIDVLQLLIKNKADVNYPTVNGFTPLHEAALRGCPATVKFLVKNNALVNFSGVSGVTPLHCAIQGMSVENAVLLLRNGAKADQLGYSEGTPLQLAKQLFQEEQYTEFTENIRKYNPSVTEEIFKLPPYNYETLPEEIKELAAQAGIESVSINRNFHTFLNTFSLLYPDKIECPPKLTATFDTSIDPRSMYDIEEASGSGGFGRVFVARCKRTRNLVAIKILPHVEKKQVNFNQTELETLRRSQCRNVVTLLGAYLIKETREVWIVTEYLAGGTLWETLVSARKRKKSFTEAQIAFIAKQLLEALVHIHSNHIVHRDIKSNNIIFNQHGDLKVIDFGLALDLNGDPRARFRVVGSPLWIAPEIIKRLPQTCSVDLWGLGLTILELCNGDLGKEESKLSALFHAGIGMPRKLSHPDKWSKELQHFVGKCLRQEPALRGTAELLLQHEWLNNACPRQEITKLLSVHTVMLNDNIQAMGF